MLVGVGSRVCEGKLHSTFVWGDSPWVGLWVLHEAAERVVPWNLYTTLGKVEEGSHAAREIYIARR